MAKKQVQNDERMQNVAIPWSLHQKLLGIANTRGMKIRAITKQALEIGLRALTTKAA